MEKTLIEFTPEQQEILWPMISLMKEGESMIAQVYIDGMRLKLLDVDTSERVRVAIGTAPPGLGRRYVFDEDTPLSLPENTVTPNA